jgi:hypothetical protein
MAVIYMPWALASDSGEDDENPLSKAEGILSLIWTNVGVPTRNFSQQLLSEHCYQRHRDIASRVFWF